MSRKASAAAEVAVLQPVGRRLRSLDMGKLDVDTLRALGDLVAEGESANTRASYQSAAKYWVAWFELRYHRDFDENDLPLGPEVMLQFIADHAQRASGEEKILRHELPASIDEALVKAGVKKKPGAMALNTLEHRLSAMAAIHRSRGLDSPTEHHDVRRVMRAARSAYAKRGQLAQKKTALELHHLERLLATCDETPQGVRDRALLLFAFDSGGRRRSEIARADLALLRKDGEGFIYNLAVSKTNQAGKNKPENHKPLFGRAAEALRAWLQLLEREGMDEGAIFRRIRRGGHIQKESLSDAAVWEIVSRRCKLAGLDEEGNFSAHSLRSGFLTEAGARELPLKDMMALSGHSDVKTALGYIHMQDMKHSPAAGLSNRPRTRKER